MNSDLQASSLKSIIATEKHDLKHVESKLEARVDLNDSDLAKFDVSQLKV